MRVDATARALFVVHSWRKLPFRLLALFVLFRQSAKSMFLPGVLGIRHGVVVAAVIVATAPFALAVSVCPGDADGDGAVTPAEVDALVRAVFGGDVPGGDSDGEERAATVVEAIAMAGLQRPICAIGLRSWWQSMPALPSGARQELGVAVARGQIFVVGGIVPRVAGVVTVEAFDPDTSQWRSVAPLPRALHHLATAGDGDRLYVAGGYEGFVFRPVDTVYRYDPEADAWETLPPLPVAVGAAAAAVVNGQLHVVGGGRGIQSVPEHQVLDLATHRWRRAAALPEALNHLAAVVRAGRVYVVGGRRDPSGLQNSAALYEYNAEEDRWEGRAPMPTARSGHAAAVVGPWLVVFGGEVNLSNPRSGTHAHVELYHFERNAWWSDRAMPLPRHGFGAASVDNTVYLPGGATLAGYGATAWHDRWELRSE